MKGPENKLDLRLTLEELYNGVVKEVTVRRNVYCSTCKGSGAEGGKTKTCPKCNGQGVVKVVQNMGFMQIQTQQPCDKCKGKGRTNEKDCKVCKGRKVQIEPKDFSVDIARGMANNEKIVYERQGEQVPDMLQGDIIFVVKQQPHGVFKRVQNNLYMNVDVTLKQALFGYEGRFTHLDGHTFEIRSQFNQIIKPFSWNIVKGEGMPIKNQDTFGELHAKMMVVFPTKLTQRQKELVELIFPDDDEVQKVSAQ
jgi:DnaJ-class molecular chaperone